MSDWISYLPDGVQNPIVIELRHPPSMRADRQQDEKSRAEAIALVNDSEFLASRKQICQQLGADHISVLTIPVGGGPGGGGGVGITVHLPPTVTGDPASAAQAVLEWFDSSKLGQIYLKQGQSHGLSKAGFAKMAHGNKRYNKLADIANLKPEYKDGYQHSKGHCACH
ncbi:MAG: hypothetical protein M3416_01060 [Acidobacteriota bacterium]|nr:hypothetical protein [Acidobacteriota bacterium]